MKTTTSILAATVLFISCAFRTAPNAGALRVVGHRTYEVVDTAGFYLYRNNKLVQGEKIARPQTVYYFSLKADEPVRELTLANLERAFAGKPSFRYALEATFRSDKDLIAYDPLSRVYKIKYLYSHS